MNHTQECMDAVAKSHEEFERKMRERLDKLHAAGVDTSMMGFGHVWQCICGTDKEGTQHV